MSAKKKVPVVEVDPRSHAARASRGRITVAITLSPKADQRLDRLATKRASTRSAVVEALILGAAS
jgi:hypothetical protein